jgi:hypothetical protein
LIRAFLAIRPFLQGLLCGRHVAVSGLRQKDPFTLYYDNDGAASQILVFAECTSSLKIMANKVLEII